jgi:hypothetical protein
VLAGNGVAATIAGVIVVSASLTAAGEILSGHLIRGVLLSGMLVVFMWQWFQLRSGSDRVTPDTLAASVSAIAGFGLALPRLDIVVTWLRGG